MEEQLTEILTRDIFPYVVKPGQYIGGEYNSRKKDWQNCTVRGVFIFPDTYEIGMSHLGSRILYDVINRNPSYLLERAYAPLPDMEALLRQKGLPLFSLESKKPLGNFDYLAFTLQYELSYSNVLNLIDLAGLPVLSAERASGPLVLAGGPCAYNPEPLADFVDAFMIGDGEESFPEVVAVIEKGKAAGWDKKSLLRHLADVPGVYVPRFYEVTYRENGKIAAVTPQDGVPPVVYKRVVQDMDACVFPQADVLPNTQIVHDRMMLEVMRGCNRGCRFCQAGVVYRPVREKTPQVLRKQAALLQENCGYDEISLVSLSSADYSGVEKLVTDLLNDYEREMVSVSLPSLRADAFSIDLAKKVQRVRRGGITLAPEAGTQRLRDVINKGVTEEDVLSAAQAAFAAGWTQIKLYFMIGLPQETDEDLDGMVQLAQKIVSVGQKYKVKGVKKPLQVTVSAACFVPKAQTPFEFLGQEEKESIRKKQAYLTAAFRKNTKIKFHTHELHTSFLEASFARGDRRLGQVLLKAWQLGCKFDGWTEHFRYDLWQQAFTACGIAPSYYANQAYAYEDILAWEHISCGVSKKWLWQELQKAYAGVTTQDCRRGACNGCGICETLHVDQVYVKEENHD